MAHIMRDNGRITRSETEAGLTIIELLVTLVVVGLLLGFFYQGFTLLESQRVGLSKRSLASDIAHANLRKFASRPSALVCTKSEMDLTTPGTKSGSSLASYFTQEPSGSLGTATQTVVAFAPDGCNSNNTYVGSFPVVKIVSTVTYGGESVSHATFVQ